MLGLALWMRSELRSGHVRVSAVLGQGKQSTHNLKNVDFRFLKPFKLIPCYRATAKTSISLKLQPNLLTLRDFTLKHDSKDVDFTSKRANCSFHVACKLKNGNFRPK